MISQQHQERYVDRVISRPVHPIHQLQPISCSATHPDLPSTAILQAAHKHASFSVFVPSSTCMAALLGATCLAAMTTKLTPPPTASFTAVSD